MLLETYCMYMNQSYFLELNQQKKKNNLEDISYDKNNLYINIYNKLFNRVSVR